MIMKKFSALLLVILAAVTLSACHAFHDDSIETYTIDDPYEATIFLQIKDLTATSATIDLAWTEWRGATLRHNQAQLSDGTTAVEILDINLREAIDVEASPLETYTVDLTLTNVPATAVHKTVRPFKIYYTQTIFNPLSLLPNSDTFTYFVGFTTSRRHSATNTDLMASQDDGTYAYLWTTDDTATVTPIEFKDTYPNRPLYYVLAFLGAAALGVVVFFMTRLRDNDCKKPQETL